VKITVFLQQKTPGAFPLLVESRNAIDQFFGTVVAVILRNVFPEGGEKAFKEGKRGFLNNY